ncbi:MAG: carboxypeptidase-like regulatory domain-containing protein [Gemmata sp.]
MRHPRVAFGALLLALLAVTGCKEREPARGVVKGRVTLGDRPVTGATVFFENAQAGVGMNAPLDADGNYEVKSYRGAGLYPGVYQVAVVPGAIMEPGEELPLADKAKFARPKPAITIPERYHKTATSELSVEVKEGANPPFDFKLAP